MTVNFSDLGIKPRRQKKVAINITDAILLSRVSSLEQQEGYSLEAQEERLRKYCNNKSLNVVEVRSFAESSTRGTRPKFRDMIKKIKSQKRPIAIVCDKVDRLQRGFKETTMIESLRVSGKAELHFVSDGLILHKNSSSQDLMRYNFMVLMAQNYTDCISENVIRAHEQMIREGKSMGLAPLGYKNIRYENKMADVILDEERCFLVTRIFEEFSTGLYSLKEIAEMTSEWGLTTKTKPHKPLCKSQIEKILKNPFYCGFAQCNGVLYEHKYQKLISMETFMKCVDVRKGRNKQFSKTAKHETIFKGLVHCHKCGCTVTPDLKKGKYIYLKPNTKKDCDCKQINENIANELVKDVLTSIKVPKATLSSYINNLRNRFNKQEMENVQVIKNFKQQLNTVNAKLERLNDIYLDGDVTKNEYTKKKESLLIEKQFLEQKINTEPDNHDEVIITLEYLFDVISRLYFLYQSSRIEQKRKILNLVFSNFWLNGQNLSYEIKKPFDIFIEKANRLKNWVWWDSNPRPID